MDLNVVLWQKVHIRNKELDDIFIQKYDSPDAQLYEKNCIEFLVELGEFINATKCFKYWSIKKVNKDEMLEELADNFTMLMQFYSIKEYSLPSKVLFSGDDLLNILNTLFIDIANIKDNISNNLLDKIFYSLMEVSNTLGISEDEILSAINKKHEIIYERLNSSY